MTRDFRDVLKDAAALPERDRATLAGLLIESLEPEPDPGVEEAWAKEVQRRLADLDAGIVTTVSWEEVRKELFDRLNGR